MECSRLSELQKMFVSMSLNVNNSPACSLLSVLYMKALQLKFVCIQEKKKWHLKAWVKRTTPSTQHKQGSPHQTVKC